MTGREKIELEKRFDTLIHAFRNLDHMTWHHGGERRGLGMVKECVENFDQLWQSFKAYVEVYEKETFIDKL